MPTHATTDGAQTLTNKTMALNAANGNLLTLNKNVARAAAPTGTTSNTGVHVGLALTLTPRGTGTVIVVATGQGTNTSLTADAVVIGIRYGTGAAPANGDALAGTLSDAGTQRTRCDNSLPESVGRHDVITGLTPGTQYWFDLSQARSAAGTSSLAQLAITVIEV